MSNKLTWINYLDRLPGGPSDRQVALAADTNPSTVVRWRKGQDPSPRHAVMVARHFGLNPLTAFVAAGFLSTEELDTLFDGDSVSASFSLDSTPTLALVEEVGRRVKALEQ